VAVTRMKMAARSPSIRMFSIAIDLTRSTAGQTRTMWFDHLAFAAALAAERQEVDRPDQRPRHLVVEIRFDASGIARDARLEITPDQVS